MRTENLAIVFIDIAGFTPRTSSQTREENLRMLQRFDSLVRPLVRAYNGRVIKTIGDAYLLAFRSPTEALLCSAAVHDRIAETDRDIPETERFTIRAAVNAGDVRVEGGDVYGEAVNIAARIEGKAGAGEIYFSEAVYLSMTRTEVPSEEVGMTELKGIPMPVRLYRVPRASEGKAAKSAAASLLPYGGLGIERVRGRLAQTTPLQVLTPAVDQAADLVKTGLDKGVVTSRQVYGWWKGEVRRSRLVQAVTIIVLVLLIWFAVDVLKPKPKNPFQKLHKALGF